MGIFDTILLVKFSLNSKVEVLTSVVCPLYKVLDHFSMYPSFSSFYTFYLF